MKLSINMVWAALKERYPDEVMQRTGKAASEQVLSCPHYMSGQFSLRANRIYVGTEEQVVDAQVRNGPCLLIVPVWRQECGSEQYVSVVTIPDMDVTEVYNQVHAVFDRYEEWDDTLQELAFSNAPPEEFLKCSFPLIGNSM